MSMQRYMRGMSNGGLISARPGEVLDNDALRAAVPSIFATEAHESRSARFEPIPTVVVLDGLRREGFDPVFAQQARTRVEGKAAFTKHLVRMRHRSISNDKGDSFEVILTNANDGTAAYQMLPGFFRFVCANGLFVGDSFEPLKVRHSGRNVQDDVIEGSYRVLDTATQTIEQVEAWRGLALTSEESRALAESAHILRFPAAYEPEGTDAYRQAPVPAERLLNARRADDRGNDLWRTFNRVQENVVRGGLAGRVQAADGSTRRATVRTVNGIDQSTALNRALWTLTERMAALKAA